MNELSPNTTCRMCREEATLCRSHIFPRWAYVRISNISASDRNGRPLSVTEERAVFDTTQHYEPMLCDRCEDRLARLDAFAANHLVQEDGSFPLMRLGQVALETTPLKAIKFQQHTGDPLTRFFASVALRASYSKRHFRGTSLGDRMESRFASYLLERSEFPSDANLHLSILDDADNPSHPRLNQSIELPRSERLRGGYVHVFGMFGVRAFLFCGANLKSIPREHCFSRSPMAALTDIREAALEYLHLIERSRPVGAFARWSR